VRAGPGQVLELDAQRWRLVRARLLELRHLGSAEPAVELDADLSLGPDANDLKRHPPTLRAELLVTPPRVQTRCHERLALGTGSHVQRPPRLSDLSARRERGRDASAGAGIPAAMTTRWQGSRSETKHQSTHELELMERSLAEPEGIANVGRRIAEDGGGVPGLDPGSHPFRRKPLEAGSRRPRKLGLALEVGRAQEGGAEPVEHEGSDPRVG